MHFFVHLQGAKSIDYECFATQGARFNEVDCLVQKIGAKRTFGGQEENSPNARKNIIFSYLCSKK